jgi:hypothetical protein
MCDYRRDFGLDIGLISTSNYGATTNLHSSQVTTAPAKNFQSAVFNSRSLVTASNSADSSASRPQLLSSKSPVQNCLTTDFVPSS